MHNFEVTYIDGLRTKAVHLKSGTEIITDAPTDNNGKGAAFSPTDLVATALASCMLTIMGIAGQKHGFSIKNTKAEITKVMQSDPRKISEVHIILTFPQHNYDEKTRKIIEHIAHTCPVALSLDKTIKQNIELRF